MENVQQQLQMQLLVLHEMLLIFHEFVFWLQEEVKPVYLRPLNKDIISIDFM